MGHGCAVSRARLPLDARARILPCPAPCGPGSGNDPGRGRTPSSCAAWDLSGCVTAAIDQFLQGLVADLLNPGLELLSQTLLATPTPQQIPGLAGLWNSSWQILLGCYTVLVLLGGMIVMGYQSVQTRYGLREIAPRMLAGFLAGALVAAGLGDRDRTRERAVGGGAGRRRRPGRRGGGVAAVDRRLVDRGHTRGRCRAPDC